jgi:hypothetical protein
MGLVGLFQGIFGRPADDLRHFQRVRFEVPPGAKVEVNGKPVTRSVFLNDRREHTIRITHNESELLVVVGYRTPPQGGVIDLVTSQQPALPVAPTPRVVDR